MSQPIDPKKLERLAEDAPADAIGELAIVIQELQSEFLVLQAKVSDLEDARLLED